MKKKVHCISRENVNKHNNLLKIAFFRGLQIPFENIKPYPHKLQLWSTAIFKTFLFLRAGSSHENSRNYFLFRFQRKFCWRCHFPKINVNYLDRGYYFVVIFLLNILFLIFKNKHNDVCTEDSGTFFSCLK